MIEPEEAPKIAKPVETEATVSKREFVGMSAEDFTRVLEGLKLGEGYTLTLEERQAIIENDLPPTTEP